MTRRMATVRVAKAVKMKNSARLPAKLFTLRPMWITMVQSTSDSSGDRGETRHLVYFGEQRCGPHLPWSVPCILASHDLSGTAVHR